MEMPELSFAGVGDDQKAALEANTEAQRKNTEAIKGERLARRDVAKAGAADEKVRGVVMAATEGILAAAMGLGGPAKAAPRPGEGEAGEAEGKEKGGFVGLVEFGKKLLGAGLDRDRMAEYAKKQADLLEQVLAQEREANRLAAERSMREQENMRWNRANTPLLDS